MAADSLTGKAGAVTLAGAALVITKWTAKPKKEYAKSTDSSNYNAASNRLCSAQLAGEENLEGTIEGHFSKSQTPALVKRITDDAVVPIVLKLDASTTFCSCNCDLSDFEVGVTVPGAETVDFSVNFKSNGLITYP